jgi:hypothetical protein
VGLEGSDRIREFRELDSPEKDAAPGTIVIVKVELSMETEVQEVRLGEVKDVIRVGP